MFLIDTCAPKDPKKSIIHQDILNLLDFISKDDSVPHIIFYGNDGVGKRKIIKYFLEMLYGPSVNDTEDNIYVVAGSGTKVKEVLVKQSKFHIMIDPVDNNFDKYLIQDVVKKYAKKLQVKTLESKKLFKTVLMNNLDYLSYYAQTSLRRTMEKYSGTCRFIMWCKSLSRVIEPLKSRCICIRISAPSYDDMLKLTIDVALKKKINLKLDDYHKIIKSANGSVRKLLWKLDLFRAGQYNKKYETPYNETIEQIVELILKCNIEEIINIRNLIYNLIITNIEPSVIMVSIFDNICKKNIAEEKKLKIINCASTYDHNLVRRRREISHLDCFILHVMDILIT